MTIENIKQKIEEKLQTAPMIGAVIKLDFGDDGVIVIDATQSPPLLGDENLEPDTTLSCGLDVFKGIASGTQDPTMAYMMGKLKVQGNMGVAMKLNSLLED